MAHRHFARVRPSRPAGDEVAQFLERCRALSIFSFAEVPSLRSVTRHARKGHADGRKSSLSSSIPAPALMTVPVAFRRLMPIRLRACAAVSKVSVCVCVCVRARVCVCVCVIVCGWNFVTKSDVYCRGTEQACGAPSNKALRSVVRISPGTPGDVPAIAMATRPSHKPGIASVCSRVFRAVAMYNVQFKQQNNNKP